MIHRLLNPSKSSSFFIFGARGTGKSTFLEQQLLPQWGIQLPPPESSELGFWQQDDVIYYDLLNDEIEERFAKQPESLKHEILALNPKPKWVILDEIQKVPRLLDIVHSLIERQKIKFILCGSSARKLKKLGSNLLGGRAFEYALHPFTFWELEKKFSLQEVLSFGSLPPLQKFTLKSDKIKFLQSYIRTYIRVEIQAEQLLRKLDPFRSFLEISSQMSGKVLNFTKIAHEVGVDVKTIQSYYLILEETYLGFRLPAFHHSIRKSQRLAPKFFLFDLGVKRALENSLHSEPVAQTSYYGELFEHFVILEFMRLNLLLETDYQLSYFSTLENLEVDLVLSRESKHIAIEIKSSSYVDEQEISKLARLSKGWSAQAYYISTCEQVMEIEGVRCLPWHLAFKEIFAQSREPN